MIRLQIALEITDGRVRGVLSHGAEAHVFAGWLELLSRLMALDDGRPAAS